jgi:hypothetical protein
MSSSSSIKIYQIPKLCQMDINIQWRYVECDYYDLWKLDINCKFCPNNLTFSDLEWEHIMCKVLKYFKRIDTFIL